MSKNFSFCHISDLHLSIEANQQSIKDFSNWFKCKKNNDTKKIGRFTTYERVKLEALSRLLYIHRNEFDFILITGDISSSASKEDLNTAFNFISSEKEYESWILKGANFYENTFFIGHKSIILLPGNHDRIDYSGNMSFKHSDEFNNVFNKFWTPSTPSGRISSKNIYITEIEESIVVLKIDFSLRKERFHNLKIGEGYVEDDILVDLEKILSFFQEKKIFYILALHYPPMSQQISTLLKLQNEEKFINLLQKYNVPYIFSGHSHIEEHSIIPNTNIINYCSDSSTSFCENSNINIFTIDLENNKIINKRTFEWSPSKRNFFELPHKN